MKESPNILIYRLGFLGDIVVSLPCLHFLRDIYPASRITLLSDEPVSGKAAPASTILENSGLCDEFIAYPNGLRNLVKLKALQRRIASRQFDLMVNLMAARGFLKSCRDEVFFRTCGIRTVIGTPWRHRDLAPEIGGDGFYEPECERLARRVSPLGEPHVSARAAWALNLTAEEREAAANLLSGLGGDLLAVSVGAKRPNKDWGEEKWSELIRRLRGALPDVGLVLLGAPDEAERSERLKQLWSDSAVNLCGRTSPRVAAAILERSRLFVGHDSGPAHLAAVSGCPTLAIFSWNNPPGQWFPGHRSWKSVRVLYPALPMGTWKPELSDRCGPNEGIHLIGAAEVFDAALELWNTAERPTGVNGK